MSSLDIQATIFSTTEQLPCFSQKSINEAFKESVNIVHSEMACNLERKSFTLTTAGISKKKCRQKKPW